MEEMKAKWEQLMQRLESQFGKRPDLNALLLIIGMRELGIAKQNIKKEEKVDLMHIATCRVLSESGFYELEGHDKDGWPHWKLVKPLPYVDIFKQEVFLKQHIIAYFESENLMEST